MTLAALMNPHTRKVSRSELRQNQSCTLEQAKDTSVIVVTSSGEDDKLVLDKRYFEALLAQLRSAAETLEITSDHKLFQRLLAASKTVDEDIRLGKLHSFEEAFGDTEEG